MFTSSRTHFLGEGLDVNFPSVKYESIADFVGLDPLYQIEDAPTFDIYHSRTPTPVFEKIVEDIDDMTIQWASGAAEDRRSYFPILFPCKVNSHPYKAI